MARLSASPRPLGPRSLALVAYGEIGSSLVFALGIVAFYALGLTPWVLLLVGLLVLLVALSYAEGVAAVPEAGGAASVVRRAFGDPAGFATGWLLFLDYVVVIALAALFVPHYIGATTGWDAATRRPWDALIGIAAIAVIAGLRPLGGAALRRAAIVAAALALVVHLLVAGFGLALVVSREGLRAGTDLGSAPSWGSIAIALAVAMLAYTGLETVANFAAETREPGRSLPRGLLAGLVLVVVVNVAVAVVAVSAFPAVRDPAGPDGVAGGLGTTYLEAPLAGIGRAIGAELPAGAAVFDWAVGLSGTLVLLGAIATAFAGGERLAFSMARYEMLPHLFARPERGGAPSAAATLAGAAVAGALLLAADVAGQGAEFLAGLFSFGVLVAFTAAQAAVVRLRVSEAALERPFRIRPSVAVGGHRLPLPALIGALLTLALWAVAVVDQDGARLAGPAWLIAGALVYLVSRRRGRESLFGRAAPAVPDLVAGAPAPARRILVPLKSGPIGEEVLATALRLAEEGDARIEVVHVLRVPMALPLDAALPALEARAAEVLAEARELAAEGGAEIGGRVVRARSLSEAILAGAEAAGADLIVLGSSPRWRRQARVFGPTVDEVLRRSGREVIVVTYPEGLLEEDEAGADGAE